MYYRSMPEDSYLDLENPSMMDPQQMDGDVCSECPYRQDPEQEFDPTMVRQRRRRRRRRRRYYYHRPPYYPYYPPYYPPYYRDDYDED